jgi:hypothetical protein
VAYVTCPWCLTPQLVGDENDSYQCLTCYGEVRFFTCPSCAYRQSVSKRWTAFTCSKCETKVDLPRRWSFAGSTRARQVQGVGYPWPRF